MLLANALKTTVDHLLMDNITESKTDMLKEVETVFSDCSTDEIYLMLSQAENLKKNLRLKTKEKKKANVNHQLSFVFFKNRFQNC
jgi:hypothetical protein